MLREQISHVLILETHILSITCFHSFSSSEQARWIREPEKSQIMVVHKFLHLIGLPLERFFPCWATFSVGAESLELTLTASRLSQLLYAGGRPWFQKW